MNKILTIIDKEWAEVFKNRVVLFTVVLLPLVFTSDHSLWNRIVDEWDADEFEPLDRGPRIHRCFRREADVEQRERVFQQQDLFHRRSGR